MDSGTFAKVVFTTIGGTAALLLIIGFLAKKWIGTRIVESIKTVYAKQLEDIKHENAKDLANLRSKLELQNTREQEQILADKVMFQKFIETLPSSGSIAFIEGKDFGGAFDWHDLDQLRTFDREWRDAEHEFLDTQMEAMRKELNTLVREYLDFLSNRTCRLKDEPSGSRIASVPKKLEVEQPRQFHDVVNSLHEQADKIVLLHREFVRVARQRLKC